MTHYTYEPNHYKTLESGREVLLGPDDPLPPPFVGIAVHGPVVRSPCRINGYGGTMFEPPPKSYEWTVILATLTKYGHRSAKCRDPKVAELLLEAGVSAIRV
jgi:hypothetical protein